MWYDECGERAVADKEAVIAQSVIRARDHAHLWKYRLLIVFSSVDCKIRKIRVALTFTGISSNCFSQVNISAFAKSLR